MAGSDEFTMTCERCGKECRYEEMRFTCELYVCKDCDRALRERFVTIEEDDGYPD